MASFQVFGFMVTLITISSYISKIANKKKVPYQTLVNAFLRKEPEPMRLLNFKSAVFSLS